MKLNGSARVQLNASDLHIKGGAVPIYRVDGGMLSAAGLFNSILARPQWFDGATPMSQTQVWTGSAQDGTTPGGGGTGNRQR